MRGGSDSGFYYLLSIVIVMQKLIPFTAKRSSKVLEFLPKAKPIPTLTLDEFLSKNKGYVIRDPDADYSGGVAQNRNVLEFRAPKQAE